MASEQSTNVEELRKTIVELVQFKKMLQSKYEEKLVAVEQLKLKLQASKNGQAKNFQARQNFQRMTELVSVARSKAEQSQKENELLAKVVEDIQQKLENCEQQKRNLIAEKQETLMTANDYVYNMALKCQNLSDFYKVENCQMESLKLEEANAESAKICEILENKEKQLLTKYHSLVTELENEKFKTNSIPKMSVRKFLLREAKEERRMLAHQSMMVKTRRRQLEYEMLAPQTPGSPESMYSFDSRY